MTKGTNSNVPKIRFKGGTGEWEEKKLGELLSFKNGYNASKDQYGSGTKFINVLDIIENDFITHDRIIGEVNIPAKDFEAFEVQSGDLLFQRSSETREEVGQANVYLDTDKPAVFGGFVIRGRPIAPFDSAFLNISLKGAYSRREITSRSGGSTRYNIGQDSLQIAGVYIAPDIPEQTRIGSYFKELDRLIGQHQRKHEKLVTLKQAMLQKMFPQPGATTPEIRFKGFEGEWAEKSLHEITDRYDNLRVPITARNRVPGGTPYYGANGIQDYVQGYTHDGDFILVAEDGANDLKDYPVQFVSGKIWVNNHAHVLQAKKGLADNRFLKYAFFQIDVEPFLVGGGRAKLNAETMMKMKLCTPPTATEQQKIGAYFRQLDGLISQHATQLTKLKNLKAACLERMFV